MNVKSKGAPRVLSLLPSHYTDTRWAFLPYEYGMAVVSTENGFYSPHAARAPEMTHDKLKDPYERMLQYLNNSLHQSLSARVSTIIEACGSLKVDGVLNRYHVGCRIHIPDLNIMKGAITEQLGIPVLQLEWEGFDPRTCDEEFYRKQLDSFSNILSNARKNIRKAS